MRILCASLVAMCLVGCNVEGNTSSESTVTNADGTTTTTKTKTWTKNGVSGGEKTVTTMGGGKPPTIVNYEKKGGDWVEKK